MPGTCPHCNAELGLFIVVCPFCGTNVLPSEEDEPLADSGFWKVRVAIALLVAVLALILKVDRFLVLLFIPTTVLVIFAGHAAWDWIKHRNETKGRSLK